MAAGRSRTTVRAAGGGDVIVATAAIVTTVTTVRGGDVATGSEVANTAVVVKEVEVAVRSFRKVKDTPDLCDRLPCRPIEDQLFH